MKKLDLFPEKRFELFSPLSVEDALYALSEEMRYSESIYINFPFEDTSGKKFKGAINKNTFKAIRYSTLWSTYHLITIRGEMAQEENGSKVSLSLNLRKDTKISLLIISLIELLFSLYVSISAKSPFVFLVISAFVIVSYFIERLAFEYAIKMILKTLRKTFCA